jgi:hypothetical protein
MSVTWYLDTHSPFSNSSMSQESSSSEIVIRGRQHNKALFTIQDDTSSGEETDSIHSFVEGKLTP